MSDDPRSSRPGREGPVSSQRASEARDAAQRLVNGLYRVVKTCLFYRESNDAVTSLAMFAADAVTDYCELGEVPSVSTLFVGDAVFVNGKMLKTSRETHVLAVELGALLRGCEVSEVTFEKDVRRADVAVFARQVAEAWRDRSLARRLRDGSVPRIRARLVRSGGGKARPESPAARAAQTYASAILGMQAFIVDLRKGKHELPQRVKRIAQRLVAQAEDDVRFLVALTVVTADRDAAATAVASAVLAVAMTRPLTDDRPTLANVAMAALLYDVGRYAAIAAGPSALPSAIERTLNDDELDRLPARTAAMLTILGKMHPAARARAVIVYESLWQRRMHRLGPVYEGRRTPTSLSRILTVARAFSELRAAGENAERLAVDEAIQVMMLRAADAAERTYVKLLVGALGIFPAGTMVELTTGELGVVLATPTTPTDFVRPPVRVLYDAHANLLDVPFDVDLASSARAGTPRFIKRVVTTTDQQEKAMRAFIIGAQAGARRAASGDSFVASPAKARSPGDAPPKPRAPEVPDLALPVRATMRSLEATPDPAPPSFALAPGSPPPPPSPSKSVPDWAAASKHIESGLPPSSGSKATSQVSWGEYQRLLKSPPMADVPPPAPSSRSGGIAKITLQQRAVEPPSEPKPSKPPLSDRDRLLAAFITDEPIPETPASDPPGSDTRARHPPSRKRSRPDLPAVGRPRTARPPAAAARAKAPREDRTPRGGRRKTR